jgi:hypothetical protein
MVSPRFLLLQSKQEEDKAPATKIPVLLHHKIRAFFLAILA